MSHLSRHVEASKTHPVKRALLGTKILTERLALELGCLLNFFLLSRGSDSFVGSLTWKRLTRHRKLSIPIKTWLISRFYLSQRAISPLLSSYQMFSFLFDGSLHILYQRIECAKIVFQNVPSRSPLRLSALQLRLIGSSSLDNWAHTHVFCTHQ